MEKITVVTVVKNCAPTIENTVLSVVGQTYPELEFIVVDGGSEDGTLEILSRYEGSIDLLISEPDQGIYDAMNKGVRLAKGDWIYFLNSGDSLFSNDTLEVVFSENRSSGVVYGCHEADYGYFRRIHRPRSLGQLKMGMVFSHQAMFCRTELIKGTEFDTSFPICADYKFIVGLSRAGVAFEFVDLPFARLLAGGISEKRAIRTHYERWKIARTFEAGLARGVSDLAHGALVATVMIKTFVKTVLPPGVVRWLTRMKYRKVWIQPGLGRRGRV
jgi:putative colanic acid biosynthesis glycosyltransferase